MPWQNISIHAPREGSDDSLAYEYKLTDAFLSTLPVRGATARPVGRAWI